MGPIIVPMDKLSDNPAYNYLQYLFMFSLADRTTDILFHICDKSIQIYRNCPGAHIVDLDELGDDLPQEVYDLISMRRNVQKIPVPKGFIMEAPFPLRLRRGLERTFERIYKTRLEDLSTRSALTEFKLGAIRVCSGLGKLLNEEGNGYKIKLHYLEH